MYYCKCQAKAIRVLINSHAVSRFLERFWTIQVLKLRVLCSLKDWKYRDLDLKAPLPPKNLAIFIVVLIFGLDARDIHNIS